ALVFRERNRALRGRLLSVSRAGPTSDLAVLAREQEPRRRTARHREARAGDVEHRPRRAAEDRDREPQLCSGVAIVERRNVGPVVRHPPGRAGTGREPPTIDETCIVRGRRDGWATRDEVRHHVGVLLCRPQRRDQGQRGGDQRGCEGDALQRPWLHVFLRFSPCLLPFVFSSYSGGVESDSRPPRRAGPPRLWTWGRFSPGRTWRLRLAGGRRTGGGADGAGRGLVEGALPTVGMAAGGGGP